MLRIESKSMPIQEIETEDAARDVTQNPNHYLTDAEICHTRTLERDGMGILLTGNRVWHGRSEESIMMRFLLTPFDKGSQTTHSYSQQQLWGIVAREGKAHSF